MDNADTVLECGLGFTCDFNKSEPFIGQAQVLAQKRAAKEAGGMQKRLAQVLLKDGSPLLHAGDIVRRSGSRIAEVRAASYGHTLGGAVGLVMLATSDGEPVTPDFVLDVEWDVEIADRIFPCQVSLSSLYDPLNLRVKM
jgi:glycine cleavage system aminomethyltransferase T